MNYVRNPELVSPFIEAVEKDFNQLADVFQVTPSISFKTVYKICTDVELIKVYKCCGTTFGTQEQIVDHIDLVTELVIKGAKRIWTNPSNNIKKQIWGLYMTSILYAHQPIKDRIKIEISRKDLMVIISQLQILGKVLQVGKKNPYVEFIYKQVKHVLKQLMEKDAISFVFTEHNHDIVKAHRYIGKAYEELKSTMKTYLNPHQTYNCHEDNDAIASQENAISDVESASQARSALNSASPCKLISPTKSVTVDDQSTLALMDDLQDLFNNYWGSENEAYQDGNINTTTAKQEVLTEENSFPDHLFGSDSHQNSDAPLAGHPPGQAILPLVPCTPNQYDVLDIDNWANLHSNGDEMYSRPENATMPEVDTHTGSSEFFYDTEFHSASADTGYEVGVYGETGNGAATSNCLDFDNGSLLMVTKSELQSELNHMENNAIDGGDLLNSLQQAGEEHKLELQQMGFGSPVKCVQPLPQPSTPPQTSEQADRLAKRAAAMKIEFLKGLEEVSPKPNISKPVKTEKADIKLVSKKLTAERERRKALNPRKTREFEVPSELLELKKAAAKSVELKYGITKRPEKISVTSWLLKDAHKVSTTALELANLHLENKLEEKEGIRFVQKYVSAKDVQILVERADRDKDLADKLNQDGTPKGKRRKVPENHRLTKPDDWDEYFYQDKYMSKYHRSLQKAVTTGQTKAATPNPFFENYKRKYLLQQKNKTQEGTGIPETQESMCIDGEEGNKNMQDNPTPSTSSKTAKLSMPTHMLMAVDVPEEDNIMFSLFS